MGVRIFCLVVYYCHLETDLFFFDCHLTTPRWCVGRIVDGPALVDNRCLADRLAERLADG